MRSWIQVALICGLIFCASASAPSQGGNASKIGRYQIAVSTSSVVFQTDTTTGQIWWLDPQGEWKQLAAAVADRVKVGQ